MDPFSLSCSALPGAPRVRGYRGLEEVGQCFDYQVWFSLDEDSSLDVKPPLVLGQAVTLKLGGGPDDAEIAGCVAELELLEEVAHAMYRLRLVPRLWFLRHSVHSRVFVGQSVPDILQQVLTDAGLQPSTFELRLGSSYAPRDHVCQYEESDLAFVERWMEREGLYYFFDHTRSGSPLVITDTKQHTPTPSGNPVPYRPMTEGDRSAGEAFRIFRASARVLPADVTVSDYNYLTPDVVIDAVSPVATEIDGHVRQWGQNEADPAGAGRVAGLHAERELSRRAQFFAEGSALAPHAGFVFALADHPAGELNREYLAVRVVHRGQVVESGERIFPFFDVDEVAGLGRDRHRVEVDAIASDVQFRSPQRTAWPRVAGLELGRIDGPADGDYAQLDEHGRYLVKLMMDENDSPGGGASARVRHIQPHGGAPEGWHLPLRKGTEVLVAFIGGDPDRPVIAGSMHNAQNPSPVIKDNHTRNVLVTGGRSRVEMEDLDGQQYIDVSSPPESTYLHLGAHAGLGDHNIALSTDGDGLIHTTGNRDITIGGNQNEDVEGNLTETYHGNQTTHVAGAFQETIDAGATQTIHAGLTQTFTGGSTQTIAGGETRSVSGGVTETNNGSRVQVIQGASTESVSAAQTQTIAAGTTITTNASYTVTADGGITLTTTGPMNMIATGSWLMNAAGGQKTMDDHWFHIAGDDVKIYALIAQWSAGTAQFMAVALGANGNRWDTFARKVETCGIVIKNAGTERKSGTSEKIAFALHAKIGFATFK